MQKVYVRTRSDVARRFRAGMMFTPEVREVEVTPEDLALLEADPMLIVAEADATTPKGKNKAAKQSPPSPGGNETPQQEDGKAEK